MLKTYTVALMSIVFICISQSDAGAKDKDLPSDYVSGHSLILKAPHEAQIFFQRSIRSGYKKALSDIGALYAKENFSNEAYALAEMYFDAAVRYGDAHGFLGLGYLYESGFGVEKNFSRAREFYNMAISADIKDGYLHLAYLTGAELLKTDPYKVKASFERAAREGLTSAVLGLEKLYQTYPDGSIISRKAVLFWYFVHQKRYHSLDIQIDDYWFDGLTEQSIQDINEKAEALSKSFSNNLNFSMD